MGCSMSVTCAICGSAMGAVTPGHLKKHGETVRTYRERFPQAPIRSEESKLASKIGFARRMLTRTDEECARWRERSRKHAKGQWERMSQEERAEYAKKTRAGQLRYFSTLTARDYVLRNKKSGDGVKRRWAEASDVERAPLLHHLCVIKGEVWRKGDEARKELIEKIRIGNIAFWESLPDDERCKRVAYARAAAEKRRGEFTEEEKREIEERRQAGTTRYWTSLSPEERRERLSRAIRGVRRGVYRTDCGTPVVCASSWEYHLYNELERLGEKFLYNTELFDLGCHLWHPDFVLPNFIYGGRSVIIEVKPDKESRVPWRRAFDEVIIPAFRDSDFVKDYAVGVLSRSIEGIRLSGIEDILPLLVWEA